MNRRFLFLLFLAGLAACAGSGAPPAPAARSVTALDDGGYRIEVTGLAGQSAETVARQLDAAARRLASEQGQSRVAVLSRRVERIAVAGPTYGVKVPIVRSRSKSSRARSGSYGYIDLGGTATYRGQAVVVPFSGAPPPGARAVIEVEAQS